ncbi:MAG TPA: glycosyltransferase [Thermomicrobiales bacterium]|nr:glycosyltransferase [Thermomicrobiales bacterium]
MTYTIVYPLPALRPGGAEQQLLELVRGLDKRRFHPIVVPLVPGGPLEADFRAVPGAEVVCLHRRGKWDFSPVWRLAALLRSRRADVVQPYLPPTTTFAMLAALLAGTPARVLEERSGMRTEIYPYLRLQDALTRFADYVVTNSEAGRDSLAQRGIPARKILVIVNGINRERLRVDRAVVREFRDRLAVPDGGQVVGILASLTPVKRHDVFLRAAAAVGAGRPGVRYALFGDGPLRSELEAQVERLGLAGRVVFFGFQHRVAECLAACDLLVSSSEVEGLSNAIMEAMALGVPVVGTDIPGTRELVAHGTTGYLVPPGDAPALAAAIEHAFAYPDEAAACAAEAAAMIAARFSVERMVAVHEELYETLLRPGRRAAALG